METIIVGTLALDDIKTPFEDKKGLLGGSATYSSFACSFFAKPGIASIVGDDFPKEHLNLLTGRGIGLQGVETKGRTFHWSGSYEFDMNEAKTLDTQLNNLTEFNPRLPESYKDAKYVLLGNLDPNIQMKVINQLKNPALIIIDTMNFWIDTKKLVLIDSIKKCDVLVINDAEARQLFKQTNLIKCGKEGLKLGLKYVIIKKGEHGALLFSNKKQTFCLPGYPLENLVDPTGCGDSFAGGIVGYLSKQGNMNFETMKKALVYGSVIASFNAEDFSLGKQKKIALDDIEKRFREYKDLVVF